jgi:hypothetical protein
LGFLRRGMLPAEPTERCGTIRLPRTNEMEAMTMRRSLLIALLAVGVVAACSPGSTKESPAGRERQEDERARNLQGKSSANEGAKPATQSDSPYRACVRQIIEDNIQRARAAGLGVTEQNAKDTEAHAIFVCESTNGCQGETDCDRKMRHQDDVERRAIDRWK